MVRDLPPELWTPILQHVHRASRDDLLTCMQLNSKFFELGFTVMYRNVSLRLRDAVRFERAVSRYRVPDEDNEDKLCFPFVRCLRIVIPGDGRDYGFGALKPTARGMPSGVDHIARRGIAAVIECMALMSNLRTLSIVTYSGHRLNTWDEQGLQPPQSGVVLSASSTRARGPSTSILSALVEQLPSTVRNLSIDLSELSRYEPLPVCLLCSAINSKLSQLEHLNMHLRSYCGHLLLKEQSEAPSCASLRSVIMRVHGFSARLCAKSSLRGTVLNLENYTRNIKARIDDGEFPSLEQFSIISKRRPLGIRQHADAKW